MNTYIVFRIEQVQELNREGTAWPRDHRGDVPPEAYRTVSRSILSGAFQADSGEEAIVMCARETRLLSDYIAIEGTPMTIDFTAAPIAIEASAEEEKSTRGEGR